MQSGAVANVGLAGSSASGAAATISSDICGRTEVAAAASAFGVVFADTGSRSSSTAVGHSIGWRSIDIWFLWCENYWCEDPSSLSIKIGWGGKSHMRCIKISISLRKQSFHPPKQLSSPKSEVCKSHITWLLQLR